MSVSGHSSQTHAPVRPGLTLLPYPDPYRPQFGPDLVAGALDDLDRRFGSELDPDQIAAVFIEPIQSDGGVIVPPAGFLKGLEERCRAHGILIVVDEVKVGMGRTGLYHAFEAEGLTPDIVVYGKGLGGGLPISAVVGPAELMNFQPAFAIMTAAGNPVCAAAGRAVLRTIAEENLMANAARMGEHLMAGLARLAQRHAVIGHVRGRGLTVGVELVRDPASKEPASAETAKVAFQAHRLGLVFYYVGMESNVLEAHPAAHHLRSRDRRRARHPRPRPGRRGGRPGHRRRHRRLRRLVTALLGWGPRLTDSRHRLPLRSTAPPPHPDPLRPQGRRGRTSPHRLSPPSALQGGGG